MVAPSVRQATMVERLTAAGDLTSEWREAFLAVSRHRFVPDAVWAREGERLVPLDRSADERAWLDLCYANTAVITRVDGKGPGGDGREVVSSVSRPDVVARMLAALEAEPGMSVLEIGTGTG